MKSNTYLALQAEFSATLNLEAIPLISVLSFILKSGRIRL